MNNLLIKELKKSDVLPWELFLSADPAKEAIEQYIFESDIYVASLGDKIIGEYVLTRISPKVVELKNIAVDKKYQGKGYGKELVLDAIENARKKGVKRIEVGTGNSSLSQLALYQKCGFQIVGIEKDFFAKNYKEEIIENDIVCKDMIRLAIDFT